MSIAVISELCNRIVGTCLQLTGEPGWLWITGCQLSEVTGEAMFSCVDMAGQPVEKTVSVAAIERVATRKVDRRTFLSHNDVCPLCFTPTSQGKRLFRVAQLFWQVDVIECATCRLAYKEYCPNEGILRHLYGADYVHFAIGIDVTDEISKYDPRVRRMGKPRGRHLDYGCGSGHLVAAALRIGWDSYGCDPYLPSITGESTLRDRLFCLDVTDPRAAEQLGQFDCISLWAVFEHLQPLRSTLDALIRLLKPGGSLIANSPNARSLVARYNGPVWRMSTLLEHLQFCSPACACWIAQHYGLNIRSQRIAGSPFPLGKGGWGAGTQGLSSLPSDMVTTAKTMPPKRKSPSATGSIVSSTVARLQHKMLLDGGGGTVAELVRDAIDLTHLGDHVEVVFCR